MTEEKTGKEIEKMEALWEEEEEPKDSEINSLVAEPTVEVFLPENPLDIVIKEDENLIFCKISICSFSILPDTFPDIKCQTIQFSNASTHKTLMQKNL